MKIPVFLLVADVIFWGWQTGLWFFAFPLAVIVGCSYFIQFQWDLSVSDVKQIYRLCWLLFFILIIYLLITNRTIYFVYSVLQWLPIVISPLLLAHIYSTNERKRQSSEKSSARLFPELTFPFFALCILSASSVYSTDIYFYLGMCTLSSIALWTVRSKRYSPVIWLGLILIAGCMGFIGHIQLHQLDLALEDRVVSWLSHNNQQGANSLEQRTNIGDIGLLKLSNDILFRVSSPHLPISPLLLREAIYDKYQFSSWIASKPNFTPIKPDRNGTTWRLGKKPTNSTTITVSTPLSGGKGLLKLVDGTFEIEQLPVSQMEQNRYGAVQVTGKVDAIAYQVLFNQNFPLDSPPTERDLRIARTERPVLDQILKQFNLPGKSSLETLNRVEKFFQKNFTYSLNLAGKEGNSTPLANFLLQTRSGHCEYFATATTLLLRAAGIPARYVTGYSVHEFSPLENQYIVRSRHAHAWTLAYINNKWQTLDTTPASWQSLEDTSASQWEFITDLSSFLGWRLSACLQYMRNNNNLKYGWWIILPIILMLMRKSSPQKWARRFSPRQILSPAIATSSPRTKRNSEFDLIEQALNQQGLTRLPGETLKNWIKRQELPTSDLVNDLTLLVELYYCDRFDPQGMEMSERERLKSLIKLWLDKYRRSQILP